MHLFHNILCKKLGSKRFEKRQANLPFDWTANKKILEWTSLDVSIISNNIVFHEWKVDGFRTFLRENIFFYNS
jgi:hypothetical protein